MQSNSQRNIYVSLWYKGTWLPTGVIVFDKERNLAGFAYVDKYNGPPIDPINLDYKRKGTKSFMVNSRVNVNLLHRVFSDSLPGAWGMSVLTAEYPALKTMTDAEKLAWFGSRTVGGISYRSGLDKGVEQPVKGIQHLDRIRSESIDFHMRKLMKIAGARTKWGLVSHGGARPKVAYEDDEGNHWIAKFNLQFDPYNSARVEHASLRMAEKAGLTVPETKVLKMPDGEEVLLVKRYDRHGDVRRHQISMFSMMNEELIKGHDQADYRDMFRIVELASCRPEEDKRLLFRHMLYNIGLNNTDDHAKNFSMILLDEGYRLSPSYDITPNVYDYPHTTSVFGVSYPDLSVAFIDVVARQVGIPHDEARQIRNQVSGLIRSWEGTFRMMGITDKEVRALSSRIKVEREGVELPRVNAHDFDY